MALPNFPDGCISRESVMLAVWISFWADGKRSWAVGLFLYQSFDAIDGSVFGHMDERLLMPQNTGNKPDVRAWQDL